MPSNPTHLWQLSASEASARMASGALTSEQYTIACLQRIAHQEPITRAWAHVDAELAMRQAYACDREPRRSALHGIPVGLKDVIRTCDQPTRHNSPIYANHQPNEDATCVATLRAQGAVILGKTETLEFACGGQFPPTHNPWDASRTPGGSSSGSGAAVADGMVPLALGTQTGGSTIRPASFCGVYGMKPTLGRVALEGVKNYSVHLDTIGFFARSVADLRLLADAYRLTLDRPAGTVQVQGLRVGLCRTPMWSEAEPDGQKALEDAAAALQLAGARVTQISLSEQFAAINQRQDEIMQDGGRGAFLPEYFAAADLLHDDFKAKVENHLGLDAATLRGALDAVASCRVEFEQALDSVDVVLTLSAPGEAPVGLHTQGMATFNRMWTALQVPCISVPGMTGSNGMPIGVQLVHRRYEDQRLLDIAQVVSEVIDKSGPRWS